MGCVPCAEKARSRMTRFEWTDGTNVIVYPTEAAAKIKVEKRGGTYKPVGPAVT